MTNTNDVDDFLSHFGKKGMKWGVRTDKPSSGSKVSSALAEAKKIHSVKLVNPDTLKKRETKATKFDDKAKKLAKENTALEAKLQSAGVLKKRSYKKQISENEQLIKTAEKDSIAARDGRMSNRQKKLLIGGAVVGGLLVAYGTRNMIQSGEMNRQIMKGKMLFSKDKDPFKRNDKFADKNLSSDDIMKHIVPGINPDYGSWGTNMNCRRATFAYELRRRGFDVQATKTSNGSGQTLVGLMNAVSPGQKEKGSGVIGLTKAMMNDPDEVASFQAFVGGGKNAIALSKDVVGYTKGGAKNIFEALGKEPNGSRGEFGAMWQSAVPGIPGGGHSMAYEIIKGKAHIFDTQTGKEYKPDNKIFDSMESVGFTRLDNVDLNMEFLKKWVR